MEQTLARDAANVPPALVVPCKTVFLCFLFFLIFFSFQTSGGGGESSGIPANTSESGSGCISALSPCDGFQQLASNGALCLSGASSPFGDVLDVKVSCLSNGEGTVWSVCSGASVQGCGGCQCSCVQNDDLTLYANGLAVDGYVGSNSVCYGASFLPNAINPLSIRVSCEQCNNNNDGKR